MLEGYRPGQGTDAGYLSRWGFPVESTIADSSPVTTSTPRAGSHSLDNAISVTLTKPSPVRSPLSGIDVYPTPPQAASDLYPYPEPPTKSPALRTSSLVSESDTIVPSGTRSTRKVTVGRERVLSPRQLEKLPAHAVQRMLATHRVSSGLDTPRPSLDEADESGLSEDITADPEEIHDISTVRMDAAAHLDSQQDRHTVASTNASSQHKMIEDDMMSIKVHDDTASLGSSSSSSISLRSSSTDGWRAALEQRQDEVMQEEVQTPVPPRMPTPALPAPTSSKLVAPSAAAHPLPSPEQRQASVLKNLTTIGRMTTYDAKQAMRGFSFATTALRAVDEDEAQGAANEGDVEVQEAVDDDEEDGPPPPIPPRFTGWQPIDMWDGPDIVLEQYVMGAEKFIRARAEARDAAAEDAHIEELPDADAEPTSREPPTEAPAPKASPPGTLKKTVRMAKAVFRFGGPKKKGRAVVDISSV